MKEFIVPRDVFIKECLFELSRWNFEMAWLKTAHVPEFPDDLIKKLCMLKDEYNNLNYIRDGTAFQFLPARVEKLHKEITDWKTNLTKGES